jgi:hypothetical protein
VSRRVRGWLLAYARVTGVAPELVERAEAVLAHQVRGHSDHMHVRIACSESDVAAGRCSDDPAPRRRRDKWRSRVRCGPPPAARVADR